MDTGNLLILKLIIKININFELDVSRNARIVYLFNYLEMAPENKKA